MLTSGGLSILKVWDFKDQQWQHLTFKVLRWSWPTEIHSYFLFLLLINPWSSVRYSTRYLKVIKLYSMVGIIMETKSWLKLGVYICLISLSSSVKYLYQFVRRGQNLTKCYFLQLLPVLYKCNIFFLRKASLNII